MRSIQVNKEQPSHSKNLQLVTNIVSRNIVKKKKKKQKNPKFTRRKVMIMKSEPEKTIVTQLNVPQ